MTSIDCLSETFFKVCQMDVPPITDSLNNSNGWWNRWKKIFS